MRADQLITLPFIVESIDKNNVLNAIFDVQDCKNHKFYRSNTFSEFQSETTANQEKAQIHSKTVSFNALPPTKSKFSTLNKTKSQEQLIFEPIKRNPMKRITVEEASEKRIESKSQNVLNYDDRILTSSATQNMKRERETSLEKTQRFNQQRTAQWERALSGKF